MPDKINELDSDSHMIKLHNALAKEDVGKIEKMKKYDKELIKKTDEANEQEDALSD